MLSKCLFYKLPPLSFPDKNFSFQFSFPVHRKKACIVAISYRIYSRSSCCVEWYTTFVFMQLSIKIDFLSWIFGRWGKISYNCVDFCTFQRKLT